MEKEIETFNTKKVSIISKSSRALIVALIVMLLFSTLNWGIVTGWGNVKITHITVIGNNGLKYTALMYVPQSATDETPAPAHLMCHGASGNARNHESWAIEYARRGFVVLSIDHIGAGDGQWSMENPQTATAELFGKYLLSCPFVDSSRLVVSGHSSGCKSAYVVGTHYNAKAMVLCGGIRAAIPSKEEKPYLGNMISIIGSSEGLRTYETEHDNTIKSFEANGVDFGGADVEWGRLYGSFADGNAKKAVFNEGQVHEGAFIDKNNIAYQLDFVQSSMNVPKYIDASDQAWMYKDYVGLAGTLSFAAFLIACYLFLAEKIPAFYSILQPMPRNIGLRGRGLVISITAAILFPLLVLYTGAFGLWDLIGTDNIFFLRMNQANRTFTIAIGMNLMGLIMLALFWFTDAKKHNATLRDFGLTSVGKEKLDWGLIGRSFALAVIVITIGFTYISLQSTLLGTDFYAWFFGVRPIPSAKFQFFIPYILVWMLLFMVTSIGLNVERRLPTTGNEKKDTIIAIVYNTFCICFTVTLLVMLQYLMQIKLGLGVNALSAFKTDFTRIWGMPMGLFVAGIGHTILYRKTGSIWPGVFLMGTLAALSCVLYGQVHF